MLLSITVISLKEQLILLCSPAQLITPGPLSRTYLATLCLNAPPKSLLWYQTSLILRRSSVQHRSQSQRTIQTPLEGQTLHASANKPLSLALQSLSLSKGNQEVLSCAFRGSSLRQCSVLTYNTISWVVFFLFVRNCITCFFWCPLYTSSMHRLIHVKSHESSASQKVNVCTG